MKQYLWFFFTTFVILSGCTVNHSDEYILEEDDNTIPKSSICSVNLESLTSNYDKLIWKNQDNFMLSRHLDNGATSFDIIKSGQDTLYVSYYEKTGLPQVFTDGITYVFLGGYKGNSFNAVSVNGVVESEVFELDVDLDFDSFLSLNPDSKIVSKADKSSNKYKRNLAIKAVAEALYNYKKNGVFLPGGPSTLLFFLEAIGYLVSSDEVWVETVHSTFQWGGNTILIGEALVTGTASPFGLGLAAFDVWTNDVIIPLFEGGYLLPASDPRSPYADRIDYNYHHINSAIFQTQNHSFSWLGDSFDVELFSVGNFDIKASDWYIVDNYPNWITPNMLDKNGHVFLNVSVNNNSEEGSRPRSHTLTVKWIDPQNLNTYASFVVTQNSRPYVEPSVISFKDRKSALVYVYPGDLGDEWNLYDSPDWCIAQKIDNYTLSLSKDITKSAPQFGLVTLVVKTKIGDFPIRIKVYPEEETIAVTGVSIDHTGIDLVLGNTYRLVANVEPTDATNKEVEWTSDDSNIASVDENGVVEAKAEGETMVRVVTKDGGYSASCKVIVYPRPLCPDENHPHAIDLGLPSGNKWSCCNVDATRPTDSGGYYSWGETDPKAVHNYQNYKWLDGPWWWLEDSYTKYNSTDSKTVLDLEDDAAFVRFGSNWRTPTVDEFMELRVCFVKRMSYDGVSGTMVTGLNGNRIFIPSANRILDSTFDYRYDGDSIGDYWSSSVAEAIGTAESVGCYDSIGHGLFSRFYGLTIRPIYN